MAQVSPQGVAPFAGVASNAFNEYNIAAKQGIRYLGIVPAKYVRTFHGLVHGVVSTTALLIGTYLYFIQVVLDRQVDHTSLQMAKKHFFLCNACSGAITMLFFWNKVQSWRLPTESKKDKTLSPAHFQNFNRARGVIAPLLFPILPLTMYYELPDSLFRSDHVLAASSETIICLVVLAFAFKIILLVRGISIRYFVVYGAYPAGLALSAIVSYRGRLTTLFSSHPTLLDAYEKYSFLALTNIQSGYLWYYLYSRRLVSKKVVQDICKIHHPTMVIVYFVRMTADRWWDTDLPLLVKVQSLFITMLVISFLLVLVKTQLPRMTTHFFAGGEPKHKQKR